MIVDDLQQLKISIDKVVPDPSNARTGHDLNAIAGSLAKFGQRTPIVVNRKNNIVLKGNGTWNAAKKLGWNEIAAVFVDDDPLTATGYSLADNRIGDLSRFDNEILAKLLMSFEDITEVPGFTSEDLDKLISDVENTYQLGDDIVGDPLEEWVGMPDFENEENFGAIASVKVHIETEEDLAKFAELMGQTVNTKTKSIWYPKKENENLKLYRAESES